MNANPFSVPIRKRRALQRRPDERGYIGVTAMGIMMLLLGTSILLMGSVRDQVVSARNSQEFTSARQGIDDGTSAALTTLNGGGFDPRKAASGDGETEKGTFAWAYDVATRTVTSTGEFRDIDQDAALPLRWLNVGSKATTDEGSIVYGLAANGYSRMPLPTGATGTWTENAGAWAYGLSSGVVARPGHEEDDKAPSTVGGTFSTRAPSGLAKQQFDYALLGDSSTITPVGATVPRVITYADSAVVNGTTSYRSHLNAQFDRELLSDRTSGGQFARCLAGTNLGSGPVTAGLAYPGHLECADPAPGVLVMPDVKSGSGVLTIVVKGSVTIPADFNVGMGGQVHLYTTGDVVFTKPASSGVQRLDNLFVFAPYGRCSTSDAAQSIDLRGSLACRQITLPNTTNRFTHVAPLPDTLAHAGTSEKVVYYTESAGHVDTRTPGVITP